MVLYVVMEKTVKSYAIVRMVIAAKQVNILRIIGSRI